MARGGDGTRLENAVVGGQSLWLFGGATLLVSYFFTYGAVSRGAALAILVLIAMTVGVVGLRPRRLGLRMPAYGSRGLPAAAVASLGAVLASLFVTTGSVALAVTIAFAVGVVVGVAALAPSTWRAGPLTPASLLIVLLFTAEVVFLRSNPVVIDVEVVLREGVAQLLQGQNPYAMTFTNPYSPTESQEYFAPGILVDDRISIGFPYPPVVLLMAVPGYLLGDVRLSGALALLVVALAVHGRGQTVERRAGALAVAFAPGVVYFVSGGWTESLSILLLMAAVIAARARRCLVSVAFLAAFLVSKQYLVVALPCLWLLRPWATSRRLLVLVGIATLLVVPWALADLNAFWRALSGAQTGDLVRLDSLSFLVHGVATQGWNMDELFKWAPLVAGTLTAIAVAILVPPSQRAFVVAVALTILAAVMWSKQAFFNHFFGVGMLLFVAAFVGLERSADDDQAPPLRHHAVDAPELPGKQA